MPRAAVAFLLVTGWLAAAQPAHSRVSPGSVAEALASDPVHVEPGAQPALSVSERGRLRVRIAQREIGRIKIAVVGRESVAAAGGIGAFANAVDKELPARGTLVVTAAGAFHLVYSYPQGTRIAPALRRLIERHGDDGMFAVLEPAVDRIARIDPGAGADTRAQSVPDAPTVDLPEFEFPEQPAPFAGAEDAAEGVLDAVKTVVLAIGAVIVAVILLGVLFAWRRAGQGRRLAFRRRQLSLADTRARLTAVGDAIRELDLDHSMPGADPAGSEAYAAAVEHYDRADTALEKPDPDSLDIERADAAIAEAERSLAKARERFAAPPRV